MCINQHWLSEHLPSDSAKIFCEGAVQVMLAAASSFKTFRISSNSSSTAACLQPLYQGACTQDFAQSCPLGWNEDVNRDCVAPAGYSGRCIGRKNFQSLRSAERQLWAQKCDVSWYGLVFRGVHTLRIASSTAAS